MNFIRKKRLIYIASIFINIFLIGCDVSHVNKSNTRKGQHVTDDYYLKKQYTKFNNIREKQPYTFIEEQDKQLYDPTYKQLD